MASSSVATALLLVAALAAAAASSASAADCAKNKKVTVQNLCDHAVTLTLAPVANSPHLFGGAAYTLQPGSHAEFPVCWWTGAVRATDAAEVVFHVGPDGGSYYKAPNAQPGQRVPVTVTPHGSPLRGYCPAVGCAVRGACSRHEVPSGDCTNVQEMKIIYCNPHV